MIEYVKPETPVAIIIVALLLVVVLLKFLADAIQVKVTRRRQATVAEYVQRHNTPGLSVVIELKKRADTILPLLDQLYDQQYRGLEVVVIIKQTAGKNARPKLQYYRTKHRRVGLRLMTHTKGMTLRSVIDRRIRTPLVMPMSANSRLLGQHFFSTAVLDFLDADIDVVVPRRHVAVGPSLASAVDVTRAVWQHLATSFYARTTRVASLVDGRIYRRQALLEKASLWCMYAPRIAVCVQPSLTWPLLARAEMRRIGVWTARRQRLGLVTTVTCLSLIGVLWAQDQDIRLLAEFLLAGYSLLFSLQLVRLEGYSLLGTLSLIGFAPFSALAIVLLWIYAGTVVFSGSLRKNLAKLKFSARRTTLAHR